MSLVRPITRNDIRGPKIWAGIRDDMRKRIIEIKKARRLILGDLVSMVFENRHTLTVQIEEICRVENLTTDEQINSEIAVYNSLMPTAHSLAATLFVELAPDADAVAELKRLVGIDEHVVLHIGHHAIRAEFEPGRSENDRVSAVQYTRFALSPAARAALVVPGTAVDVEIDHPNYRHRTAGGEVLRESLAHDFAE